MKLNNSVITHNFNIVFYCNNNNLYDNNNNNNSYILMTSIRSTHEKNLCYVC